MINKEILEEEVSLLLSSDYLKDEMEPSQKPKLTMKYLHELVRKLQYENLVLASRINELEQQLEVLQLVRAEVASAIELPAVKDEPETKDLQEAASERALPKDDFIPRSVRHPAPKKKKTFWSFWTLGHHSKDEDQ